MSDRSLPTHDRDEPVCRPGLADARRALAGSRPVETFLDQVVALARREEWAVLVPGPQSDAGHPHALFVRRGEIVAAWITTAPIGFHGDQWRARLGRQAGTVAVVWSPRDGMGPVAGVLGGGFDRCGHPDPEGSDG